MNDSISVCIATYNGASFIKQQLDSILCQLKSSDEVIISDDGSTDETISIIQSYNDKRIKIYKNTGSHGYTPNFENALIHSNNDIIFLSDQDDVWLPNKVSTCSRILTECDLVVHDAIVTNSNLQPIQNSFFRVRKVRHGLANNLIKFGYLGCCLVFNRRILEKTIPFPANHHLCTHDNWLFLIGQSFYKVKIIDKPLILYRRHFKNSSTGGFQTLTQKIKKVPFMIHYRLYLIYNLLGRTHR